MGSFYGTLAPRRKDLKYESLPTSENVGGSASGVDSVVETQQDLSLQRVKRNKILIPAAMAFASLLLILFLATGGLSRTTNGSCDSVKNGYTCEPNISHFWGQYSPYFSAPSEISADIPSQCKITFAQILSRHGARDPTTSKTAAYKALVNKIHTTATSYSKKYGFIKDYTYTLGANDLSAFGQQQMINSGVKYYNRYKSLAQTTTPFIRSSGSDRVIESAQNWTQGFHSARAQDYSSNKTDGYPYSMVIISEESGFNNTLDHGLCTAFEDGIYSEIGNAAQTEWIAIFTPPITARLNKNLPGVNFTNADAIYMMDLCPFTTVSNILGSISPFCDLFTEGEWKQYDYYQSLGKFYGYSSGNPLGPTQGVGFTNELIARMTSTPVSDHTSTNSSLDNSSSTFPLGGTTRLYADFSHDNDMSGIFAAMGLYNQTVFPSKTRLETAKQMNGYSAAWSVPFAARAYFEKMSCKGQDEELVRVMINDRVMSLERCGGDKLGRCKLSLFVESLSFARTGGRWGECFV